MKFFLFLIFIVMPIFSMQLSTSDQRNKSMSPPPDILTSDVIEDISDPKLIEEQRKIITQCCKRINELELVIEEKNKDQEELLEQRNYLAQENERLLKKIEKAESLLEFYKTNYICLNKDYMQLLKKGGTTNITTNSQTTNDDKSLQLIVGTLCQELYDVKAKYKMLIEESKKLYDEFGAYKKMVGSKKCVCDGLDIVVQKLVSGEEYSRLELCKVRQELANERREKEILRLQLQKMREHK